MRRCSQFILLLLSFLVLNILTFAQDTTLTVTAAGNVGIGTTTPQAPLEVNGSTLIRSTGFLGDAGGGASGLEIRGTSGTYLPSLAIDNGTQQWNIVSWSDNALRFVKSTGTTFTPFVIYNNSFSNALVLGANGVGIGTASPTQMLQVVGNIAVSGTVDAVDISTFKADFDNHQSRYVQFGNLNYSSVNVTTTWAKLNTTSTSHTFSKNLADTKIEVYVNSRISIGTLTNANGVAFQVRVDDVAGGLDNLGSIFTSNTTEFVSMLAVFQGLAAGSHTVSVWAHAAPSGSATSVLVDPQGWGGKIIVKETR